MVRNMLVAVAFVGAMLVCSAASAESNLPVAYIAPTLLKAAAAADAETAAQAFADIGACRLQELNDCLAVNFMAEDHVAIEIIPNSQQEKVTLWMNMVQYKNSAWRNMDSGPYVTVTIDRCQQK